MRIEIAVYRSAARLHLQVRPLPGSVGDEARTRQIGSGFDYLIGSGGSVSFQNIIGLLPIKLADGTGEILGRRWILSQNAARALFLRIRANQNWHFRLFPRGTDFRKRLGEEITVEVRIEVGAGVLGNRLLYL